MMTDFPTTVRRRVPPPKEFKAWALWINYAGCRGHFYPYCDPEPVLFSTRAKARKCQISKTHSRLVRVTLKIEPS